MLPAATARHPMRVRVLHPAWALAAVMLLYGAGLAIAPVEPVETLGFVPLSYWLLVGAAFWLGLRLGCGAGSGVPPLPLKREPPSPRQLSLLIGMAGLGMLLLLVDRYVIRGAPLKFDVFAVRDALEGTPPGAVGTLGGFFGAFAPFAWIACRIAEAQGSAPRPRLRRLALLLVLAYVGLSLAAGSRSVMLVVVILHAVCLIALGAWQGRRLPWRAIAGVAALLVAAVMGSVWIMLSRLEQMGLDPLLSIQASGYAESLQPSQAALQWIESHPEHSALLAAAFSICLYVYHGLYEFVVLFDAFADQHTNGALTLWLPLKLLQILGLPVAAVDTSSLQGVREGLFTTFVGPFYIDFGWAAPLVALFVGALLGYPARRVWRGDAAWLPVATVVVAIVVMYPIMNLLDSAAGAYLLVSGVFQVLLMRQRSSWLIHAETQ